MLPESTSIGTACVIGLVLLTFAGCGPAAGPDPEEPLHIAAASDLQRVLPKLLIRYTAITGTTTISTPDASGRLAEQIKAGAPFDLFLSANRKFVDDLAGSGLILPETVQDYARGSLVLCVGPSARDLVKGLDDLKKPLVKKIAIANPDYAPYGVAARQALERANLWAGLEPRIVRAESVRQTIFYVQNGDAEAALVSRALADPKEIQVIDVDPALYDPLVQSLGVVAASRRRADAIALARFIMGDEGQAILHEAGFGRPGSPASDSNTSMPKRD
jgi:molybdate transport system substrate-binding protein